MKIKILVGAFFVIHCALSIFHLNHTTMWDDEASVVWFAKNYNQYGAIVGYDGINIFSYRNGQLINNDLVYNNPPLDIYFTAYIIRYLGDDDFTIRLTFAITGMIGLAIFLLCFPILTGKDDKWFAYSAVLLLLSVNYLLIEGNCRYYSLNFFFGALSLFATLKITQITDNNIYKKVGLLLLQLVAIYFLFLSHYLAAVCWWFACFIILVQNKQIKLRFLAPLKTKNWLESRADKTEKAGLRKNLPVEDFCEEPASAEAFVNEHFEVEVQRRNSKVLVAPFKDKFTIIAALLNTALLVITAKYFIEHQVLNRPDLSNDNSIFLKYFKLLGWLLNDLNRANVIPMWSLLLFIYLFIFKKKLISPEYKKVVLFSLVFLGASYVLNPQSTSKSNCYDLRYIYIIIPILYMWIGYLLKLLHENVNKGKYVAFVLAFIYINSTLICYIPVSTPVRLLLPAFIKERIEPFPTAYSESIAYINKNFKKRTKILTIPGYHNTVFLRYVSDKIEITNTLDENTPLRKSLIDSLGMQCLYIGKCKPEYIFMFGNYDYGGEGLDSYPYGVKDYKFIDTIDVYTSWVVDITRPELYWHTFGPIKNFDTEKDAIYILHD